MAARELVKWSRKTCEIIDKEECYSDFVSRYTH